MKKSVLVVFLFSIVTSVFAQQPVFWFPGIESQAFKLTEATENAVSNVSSDVKCIREARDFLLSNKTMVFSPDFVNGHSESDRESIDSVFSPLGCYFYYYKMPKCYTNYVNAYFPAEKFPKSNAVLLKVGFGAVGNYYLWGFPYKSSVFDRLALFEEIGCNEGFYLELFEEFRRNLKSDYCKLVKQMLYNQGKSFVVNKNGVNPLEPYMSNFVNALNAPRFAGIEECFRAIGVADFTFNRSRFLTDAETTQLKIDILSGEKDLTDFYKFQLLLNLGTDGYNQFVRAYNGEE